MFSTIKLHTNETRQLGIIVTFDSYGNIKIYVMRDHRFMTGCLGKKKREGMNIKSKSDARCT